LQLSSAKIARLAGQNQAFCGKLARPNKATPNSTDRLSPTDQSIGDNMPTAKHILVLNGPNLNLLGTREREHYGSETLLAIEAKLAERAKQAKIKLATYQSNSEAELVERIHRASREKVDFIIINPAAYTHTSVAMRDALAAVGIPFIEVHLSNVFARETFRHRSYFTDLAVGIISGLGAKGYELALEFALQQPKRRG
jgi:3-dehydroquinate dehydratase-2